MCGKYIKKVCDIITKHENFSLLSIEVINTCSVVARKQTKIRSLLDGHFHCALSEIKFCSFNVNPLVS